MSGTPGARTSRSCDVPDPSLLEIAHCTSATSLMSIRESPSPNDQVGQFAGFERHEVLTTATLMNCAAQCLTSIRILWETGLAAKSGTLESWVQLSADGSVAVGVVNMRETQTAATLKAADLDLSRSEIGA